MLQGPGTGRKLKWVFVLNVVILNIIYWYISFESSREIPSHIEQYNRTEGGGSQVCVWGCKAINFRDLWHSEGGSFCVFYRCSFKLSWLGEWHGITDKSSRSTSGTQAINGQWIEGEEGAHNPTDSFTINIPIRRPTALCLPYKKR